MYLSKQFKYITLFYLIISVVLLFIDSLYLQLLSVAYIFLMQITAFVDKKKAIVNKKFLFSNIAIFSWACFVVFKFFNPELSFINVEDRAILTAMFYLPLTIFAIDLSVKIAKACKESTSFNIFLDIILVLIIFLVLIRPAQTSFKTIYKLDGVNLLLYDLSSVLGAFLFSLPIVYFVKYSRQYLNISKYDFLVLSYSLLLIGNLLKYLSMTPYFIYYSLIHVAFVAFPIFFFYSTFASNFETKIPKLINKEEKKVFVFGFRLNFIFILSLSVIYFYGLLPLTHMNFMMLLVFLHLNISLWLSSRETRKKRISIEGKNDSVLEYKAALKTEELKEVNKKLLEKINHDSLTGLKSNYYFNSQVSELIEDVSSKFSLMAINIDDFRTINNTYGHDIGDEVLVLVSDRLKNEFSEDATVFRLRGDEFGILFFSDDQKSIEQMYSRLIKVLDRGFEIGTIKFNMDFAISIARYPSDASTASEMLQRVGIAMNVAKERRSEKRMVFYTADFINNMENRNKLERAVKKIVINREFKILYSAQHDIKTDKVRAISCNISWNNKNFENVNLKEVLSQLEHSGMLNEVYDWFIYELTQDLFESLSKGVVLKKVTIHISGVSLGIVRFLKVFANSFKSKGLPENILEFALSSEFLLEVYNQYPALLDSLNKNDITIALKDFGMGYSSLSLIKKANVSKIIVSSLLTEHLDTDNEDFLVVKSIMMIGNGLDISLLANGIERISQYSIVERLGCDYVSGPYLSSTLEPKNFWNEYAGGMI